MLKYKQVIVVEGKNDQERISKLFKDILVITTNGSEISKDTITTLQTLSLNHEIILLLDPDYPGERIRKTIENNVNNVVHAFINKSDAISNNKKKVGVEHATNEVIIASLENLLTTKEAKNYITLSFLYKLNLAGSDKSSSLRDKVSNYLNIGKPNAKAFLKRLNYLGLTQEELFDITKEVTK